MPWWMVVFCLGIFHMSCSDDGDDADRFRLPPAPTRRLPPADVCPPTPPPPRLTLARFMHVFGEMFRSPSGLRRRKRDASKCCVSIRRPVPNMDIIQDNGDVWLPVRFIYNGTMQFQWKYQLSCPSISACGQYSCSRTLEEVAVVTVRSDAPMVSNGLLTTVPCGQSGDASGCLAITLDDIQVKTVPMDMYCRCVY